VPVDLAFVDAIHTGDFVRAQYAILKRHMRPGGLILFDDIAFSDDMASCWAQIAQGDEVIGSARLGRRVGVIEVS
jgi:predicted O-methyltransferase YrrM